MAYVVHNFEQGDILYASQLNEMDAQIALNEQNIEDSVSSDMLAETYSANKTYSVGDYVVYNNDLYVCIYEITAPEGWNSAHWQASNLGDGISDVKNAIGIKNVDNDTLWEIGHITASDGTNASGDTYNRIRTKALIPSNVNAINVADGYYIWIYCYDSDGVYQGIWKGEEAEKSWTYGARYTGYVDLKAISETWQYRLLAATTDGQTQLVPQDAVNFAFVSFTDTTLSISGRAADAKATGIALAALDKDYEVVDNYAGLLTSTKDKVLVLHNNSYYGDGGECWFEKLADKTVGGYVRTSDGARMYPCANQIAPVPCNVPKEDLLNVMMSYYNQTGLVYGQQHTLYLPEVTNEIDCSSFVSAVLAGITYDNSRYVKGDSAINTIGVSVGTNLNRYDANIGWDRFLTYEFPMYYGEQKRLFLMPSSPIEACNLLQFGDILLMYDDQDASRDKQFNVGHVAFVVNTIPVNNTVTIIQAGGVGNVIPKRNNESKVVKTTELTLTSEIIASHIQAFIRPQYQIQTKASNDEIESIENFGNSEYVFDADFEINAAINATSGRIEGTPNANFAATSKYYPIKSGAVITYTGTRSDPADDTQFDPNIYEYDVDYNFIQTQYIGNMPKTLSTNTKYIRFAFGFNASKNKTITLALLTHFGAKMSNLSNAISQNEESIADIQGMIATVEGSTASKAYAIGDAFLHAGALYKVTASIASGDAITPGANCTQTTLISIIKGE